MTEEEIRQIFLRLFDDVGPAEPNSIPLLAHYTKLDVLESMIQNEELWMANPLYMNDHDEIRFGIIEGRNRVYSSAKIRNSLALPRAHDAFMASFEYAFRRFVDQDVLDVFVLCFTRHCAKDNDGRLSMWRSYGANASGACIVFDPKKIPEADNLPFMFSKVSYSSTERRLQTIDVLIDKFCGLLDSIDATDLIAHHGGHYFFERLKLFALFNKHSGFGEEREWRLVYRLDMDENQKYKDMIDYKGARGLEPKLKLKLRQLPHYKPDGIRIESIVDRIILGPTNSNSPIRAMVDRMLIKLQKADLREKVFSSTIPYRSTI
jgi:hypothetical protein